MHKCKYCKKEYDSGHKLGGHVTNCKMQPNYEKIKKERAKKQSEYRTGKKLSDETKNKISKARIKYLKENPDKVPYKINHSSNVSYPEQVILKYLKEYKILGWVHQLQFSIYQIDFAFPEYKLAVEIDGHTHTTEKVKKIDNRRDKYLESKGWRTLRITTKEVRNDVYECINIIQNELGEKLIEIPKEFLNKKYLQNKKENDERKRVEKNKILKQEKIETLKQKILNSDIDFEVYGWVGKVSKILNINSQHTTRWMKRNMLNFYNTECFIRKTPTKKKIITLQSIDGDAPDF